ncbi:hypothetical protein KRZ98_16550 [Sphingobium sp. AS12]|uniref:hypothetical protein n=1 Tax=Sphingobium sp. AS12 TaxID=2849495 RepID=UPI001C315042|nr:hypothetical protein [Sphingobium sp. AS12]MBV2149856.1 hypothetical protein [Sphingobium sp. AS12]
MPAFGCGNQFVDHLFGRNACAAEVQAEAVAQHRRTDCGTDRPFAQSLQKVGGMGLGTLEQRTDQGHSISSQGSGACVWQ